MASGHRKRKAAALRIEVLNPAGLTNVSEADRGNTTNQNNLLNIAFYSKDGIAPTFTAASTTLLSNAISNVDGLWTAAGLTGETTNAGAFITTSMSASVGILAAGTKHYYFPAIGSQTNLSGTNGIAGPAIIYSTEGPQASYVPYYLGGTTATSSILFGAQITGAGSPTHVVVYVGGNITNGDQIRIVKPTDGSLFDGRVMSGSALTCSNLLTTISTASALELTNGFYRKAILIPTGNIASALGMVVEFSSSAKTSTTPVPGVFVAVSSGTYGLIP